jgi:hypothetical protein
MLSFRAPERPMWLRFSDGVLRRVTELHDVRVEFTIISGGHPVSLFLDVEFCHCPEYLCPAIAFGMPTFEELQIEFDAGRKEIRCIWKGNQRVRFPLHTELSTESRSEIWQQYRAEYPFVRRRNADNPVMVTDDELLHAAMEEVVFGDPEDTPAPGEPVLGPDVGVPGQDVRAAAVSPAADLGAPGDAPRAVQIPPDELSALAPLVIELAHVMMEDNAAAPAGPPTLPVPSAPPVSGRGRSTAQQARRATPGSAFGLTFGRAGIFREAGASSGDAALAGPSRPPLSVPATSSASVAGPSGAARAASAVPPGVERRRFVLVDQPGGLLGLRDVSFDVDAPAVPAAERRSTENFVDSVPPLQFARRAIGAARQQHVAQGQAASPEGLAEEEPFSAYPPGGGVYFYPDGPDYYSSSDEEPGSPTGVDEEHAAAELEVEDAQVDPSRPPPWEAMNEYTVEELPLILFGLVPPRGGPEQPRPAVAADQANAPVLSEAERLLCAADLLHVGLMAYTRVGGILSSNEPRSLWLVHLWYAVGCALRRVPTDRTQLVLLRDALADGRVTLVCSFFEGSRPAPPGAAQVLAPHYCAVGVVLASGVDLPPLPELLGHHSNFWQCVMRRELPRLNINPPSLAEMGFPLDDMNGFLNFPICDKKGSYALYLAQGTDPEGDEYASPPGPRVPFLTRAMVRHQYLTEVPTVFSAHLNLPYGWVSQILANAMCFWVRSVLPLTHLRHSEVFGFEDAEQDTIPFDCFDDMFLVILRGADRYELPLGRMIVLRNNPNPQQLFMLGVHHVAMLGFDVEPGRRTALLPLGGQSARPLRLRSCGLMDENEALDLVDVALRERLNATVLAQQVAQARGRGGR